jgi:hypothetical protein
LWREEIPDSVTWDSRDLDIALAGQALEIEIGQTEGDTELGGESTLRGPAISIEFVKEKKVSLTL